MALTIPYDRSGVDPKVVMVIDQIVAAMQTWAGAVDGINAAERLNELTSGIASLPTVPLGTILPYAGATAPSGYLLCNGSAVSRTTYASLYVLVGTTYGSGDGISTFNIPDLRQRFPLGKAASGTGATLGSTGGTIDHTHTGPSHTHTGPSHTHTISSQATHTHTVSGTTGSVSFESTAKTVDNDGGGSTTTVVGDVGPDGGLVGPPSTFGHSHTDGTLAADAGGSHDHTGATGAGGTGDTGASGTGATGTGNPPYQAVNYILKT